MIAILLAMLAMRTILLVASNDCQYCQLSAMCAATTAINCPGGSLFTAALAHSCGIIAVLAMNCPVTPFGQQTAKQQTSKHRKAEQPKASTNLHWKLFSNKCQSLYFRLKLLSLRNCHHSGL